MQSPLEEEVNAEILSLHRSSPKGDFVPQVKAKSLLSFPVKLDERCSNLVQNDMAHFLADSAIGQLFE